ncbi:MAG: ABC transporter permease [Elusimicrobia bacterium]|nr:ABC transporter permease [Elusimicrobiota bacterium]
MKNNFAELGDASVLFYKTFKAVIRGRIDWKNTVEQMLFIGVSSVPLAVLCGFFTGMVLALQTGETFRSVFNEPIYVGLAVSYSMILELGPVLTSIVVAGRAGAAMTAEIGTMKVTEQIDALYTLGTEPVEYICVPRFIAFVIALPFLVVFSNCSGIFGGLIVSLYKLNIPFSKYWEEVTQMGVSDLAHGLIKTLFFALIIAWVSCYNGLITKGGAEGVGKATTRAVVTAMVTILVTDYFLSSLLLSMGIG